MLDLVLLSMFGALFVVPLNAFVQSNAPAKQRARILALNNLMNALFMLIAAVVGAVLLSLADMSILIVPSTERWTFATCSARRSNSRASSLRIGAGRFVISSNESTWC